MIKIEELKTPPVGEFYIIDPIFKKVNEIVRFLNDEKKCCFHEECGCDCHNL